MASAKGRVVRVEETDDLRAVRIAQKELAAAKYALERAVEAEDRAISERKRLEAELVVATARLNEVADVTS